MQSLRKIISLLLALALLSGALACAAEVDTETEILNESLLPSEEQALPEPDESAAPEEAVAPAAGLREVQEPSATPDPWIEPMPIAPEPELRAEAAEPVISVEEGWIYDADARELVIICAPDALEFSICWSFDGDAAGYRVEIGPEGGACGEDLIAEIECGEPRLTLETAKYAEGAHRLCIHAVLEDGSERTAAYTFRLESASADEPIPEAESAQTGRDERVVQVLSQGDVIVTGAMPLGAELTVETVPLEELTDHAGDGRTILFAYSIGISAMGEPFQPEEPLTVTVALNEVGVANLDVRQLTEEGGAQTIAEDVPVGSAIEFSVERLGILFGAAELQPVPEGADYLLASNSIRVYSQGSKDYIGQTSCLQQYDLRRVGCGVFAVAHALQWMGCDGWSGLDDFLGQIGELTHPADYGYAFAEGVNEIYPDFTLGSISPNEGAARYYDELQALFARGGCGMFSHAGHYILVVGFSSDGSKVHVIDSSAGSTLSHMGSYHAYYCDPLAKQWVTISPDQDGAWDVPGRYSASGTWVGMKSYGREYWVDRAYVYYGNKAWYNGTPMITFTPGAAPEHKLYTTVSRESCVYRMTGSDALNAEPFDGAEAVDALEAGDRIVSCELVDNGDELWLRIKEKTSASGETVSYDAAYIRAGDDSSGAAGESRRFELVENRPGVEWAEGNIEGAMIAGTTSINGTISCADRMTRITAEFRRDGVRWGDAVSVSPTASRQYAYPLHGSTLDTGLRFGSLPDGDYQLVFTVEYSYNCNQSTGRAVIAVSFSRADSAIAAPAPEPTPRTSGPWVYRVAAAGGLNMRSDAKTAASLVVTLWSPASVTVTRKVTADGYTWGYGTASSGETGWIVVDNGWTILAD